MGISGYEAIVMVTISPFLLGIGSVKRLVIANIRYMHLLSLSGLLAYLIAKPENRLFAVGFGVWMSCLSWSATFVSERSNPGKLELRVLAFSIGLIVSSLSKFAFRSNNPIWPIIPHDIGGWQKTGITLAVLSFLRITRQPYGSSTEAPEPLGRAGGSSILSGLGLAGLFFALHSLLSDTSTMILWGWEGYPVSGPLPVPYGAITIFFMSVGLLVGIYYPTQVRAWTGFGAGCHGAIVLTQYSEGFGYYGAMVFTTYIMAIAPTLLSSAAKLRPGLTFFIGFFIYNLMVLAHVWTVAYAFVPGGFLLRERTDLVMAVMMGLVGCGVFSAQSMQANAPSSSTTGISPFYRKQRSYYIWILMGLQLLSGSVAYLRFPSYDYKPHHAPEKSITAGIWTIHFGLDNGMWSSEKRMADLIRETELDVVGLLESDLQRIIMGNRDSTQYISEELGMWVDQGPGPNKHTWGCALLSKFPIINSTHHLLPSPVGELAPAIHATIDAYGELVDVFVFHSGQEEDPEDRRLQSEYLAELMGSTSRPSILLSYLVTKPGEGNYNNYVSKKSGMRDIDPSDWDRWCEYILYKGMRRAGYARVSRDSITDTELQVCIFMTAHLQQLIVADWKIRCRSARREQRLDPRGPGAGRTSLSSHVQRTRCARSPVPRLRWTQVLCLSGKVGPADVREVAPQSQTTLILFMFCATVRL